MEPADVASHVEPDEVALPSEDPLDVRLRVERFVLAEAPGNHIHLTVDDRPEIAVRDISGPLRLDELYQEKFGEPLAEGSHILRVFLSRSNHESVKVPGAFAMVVFHVGSRMKAARVRASKNAV